MLEVMSIDAIDLASCHPNTWTGRRRIARKGAHCMFRVWSMLVGNRFSAGRALPDDTLTVQP